MWFIFMLQWFFNMHTIHVCQQNYVLKVCALWVNILRNICSKSKKNFFYKHHKDYNIICILGVLKNLQRFIRLLKTMQVSEMFISLFRVTQSLMCYEG